MPRAYSEDLHRRIVADTNQELSIRVVAKQYSVSPSFVSKLTRVWRRKGSVASHQIGGYKQHALAEHAKSIRRQLAEQTDLTLVEVRDWAQTVLSVRVYRSAVDRFLRSLGYRYKKTLRASEQDVLMSPRPAQPGRSGNQPAIPHVWSFWMKRARRRT